MLMSEQYIDYIMHGAKVTECSDRNITLARLCTTSLRMIEDRNM